jgi:hypothetical protein
MNWKTILKAGQAGIYFKDALRPAIVEWDFTQEIGASYNIQEIEEFIKPMYRKKVEEAGIRSDRAETNTNLKFQIMGGKTRVSPVTRIIANVLKNRGWTKRKVNKIIIWTKGERKTYDMTFATGRYHVPIKRDEE